MKRRYVSAITIGIAVLLIGSVAFAADRRRNAKNAGLPANEYLEDEALRAELHDALEEKENRLPDKDDANKVTVAVRSDERNAEHPDSEKK